LGPSFLFDVLEGRLFSVGGKEEGVREREREEKNI